MKIALIGTGFYSVGLALSLGSLKENKVYLWTESEEVKQEFSKKHTISKITDKKIPKNIYVETNLEECVRDAKAIFLLTSSKYVRSTCLQLKEFYKREIPIFLGSKGLDMEAKLLSSVVLKTLRPKYYASISGPTFAQDLMKQEIVNLCVATNQKRAYQVMRNICLKSNIILSRMKDYKAIDYLSTLKNIFALGAGYVNGLGYGESTNAYYLTKCFNELVRLAYSFDFDPYALLYSCGIGDLILTCSSKESRNYTYGMLFAQNKKKAKSYLEKNTVEGFENLQILSEILEKKHIHNPLLTALQEVFLKEGDKSIFLTYLNEEK